MEQHRDYVRHMVAQGQIFLDAGAPDGTIGVIIYRVFSAIEAWRHFYSDPAVIAGLGYHELYPLTVGHLAARLSFPHLFGAAPVPGLFNAGICLPGRQPDRVRIPVTRIRNCSIRRELSGIP